MATASPPPVSTLYPPKEETTSASAFSAPHPLSLLPNCNSLKELKQIQAFTLKTHLQRDISVINKLVNFCTQCPNDDSIGHAQKLFDEIPHPDIVLFNTMSRGYSRVDDPLRAMALFVRVLNLGLFPDDYSFPSLLKACAGAKALAEGKQLHCFAVKLGLTHNAYVSPTLINMYTECGDVDAARRVFDKISDPCVVVYNSIINGYVRSSRLNEASSLFRETQASSPRLDDETILSVLTSRALLGIIRAREMDIRVRAGTRFGWCEGKHRSDR